MGLAFSFRSFSLFSHSSSRSRSNILARGRLFLLCFNLRSNRSGSVLLGFFLVVCLEDLPSSVGHESLRLFSTFSSELSHLTSRDELPLVSGLRVEEFHFVSSSVESSELEGENLDSVKEVLAVLKKLLTVPDIIERLSLDSRMTNTSRISTSNEVSDSSTNSGRAMPQDFSGTSIEHGRRPDG